MIDDDEGPTKRSPLTPEKIKASEEFQRAVFDSPNYMDKDKLIEAEREARILTGAPWETPYDPNIMLDIASMTELKTNPARFVCRACLTKAPVHITSRGRAMATMIDHGMWRRIVAYIGKPILISMTKESRELSQTDEYDFEE